MVEIELELDREDLRMLKEIMEKRRVKDRKKTLKNLVKEYFASIDRYNIDI